MVDVVRTVKTFEGERKVKVPEEWDAAQITSALEAKGVQVKDPSLAPAPVEQTPVEAPVEEDRSVLGTILDAGKAAISGTGTAIDVMTRPVQAIAAGVSSAASGGNPIQDAKQAFNEGNIAGGGELLDISARPAFAVEAAVSAGITGEDARKARDEAFFTGKRTKLGEAILTQIEKLPEDEFVDNVTDGVANAIGGPIFAPFLRETIREGVKENAPQIKGATAAIAETAFIVTADPLNALFGVSKLSRLKPLTKAGAEKTLVKIEEGAEKFKAQGLKTEEAVIRAADEVGVPQDLLIKSMKKADRKVKVKLKPTQGVANPKIQKQLDQASGAPALKERKFFVESRKKIDAVIRPVASTIWEKSPRIAFRVRNFEMSADLRAAELLARTNQYGKAYKALKKADQQRMDLALFNGKFDDVRDLLNSNSALKAGFDDAIKIMQDAAVEMKAAGYDFTRRDNFWHSRVKDIRGLLKKDGKGEQAGRISKALESAAKNKKRPLTDEEQIDVIQKSIVGERVNVATDPNFLKDRTRLSVTEKDLPFYDNSAESLNQYVREFTHNIEKQKLFGTKFNDDVVDSVDTMVFKELSEGRITLDEANDISELLKVRFGPGEKLSSKPIQFARNLLYADTLLQVRSALTQFGDLAISAYVNGIRNTVVGIAKSLTGKSQITRETIGVSEITAELATTKGTARVMNAGFKAVGFRFVDSLGKNAFLQAGFRKLTKQVKTQKGIEQIANKYRGALDDAELAKVIDDLQNGRVTNEVKQVMFNELSEAQPISKIELPKKYLDAPNGRILYSLLSFTLKQIDLARNTALRQMVRGESLATKVKGAKDLVRLGVLVTGANMTVNEMKDFLKGRPAFDTELTMENVALNLIKNFGLSDWTLRNIEQGKLADAIVPAVSVFGAGAQDVTDLVQGDGKAKMVRHIPVIGDLWYQWFGGGIEAAAEFERKKEVEKRNKGRSDDRERR